MSVPISATEELVLVVRGVLRAERGADDGPHATMGELAAALATWDLDWKMPEAAKADRVEVKVPVPVKLSDWEILDRAADILEDVLGEQKGFLRNSNTKAMIRLLPDLARKLRKEQRDGDSPS